MIRDTTLPLPAVEAHGRELFEHLYGETSDTVQGLLDAAYPDMGKNFFNVVPGTALKPQILYSRMVLPDHRIRTRIWREQHSLAYGNILRASSSTNCRRHSSTNRVAYVKCTESRREFGGSTGGEADLD